jgi:PKHD-type hydroxylase|tara:strand:- start:716 stop:1288 length:573 start_codon:yes stop_codon:yes gene_type:complete
MVIMAFQSIWYFTDLPKEVIELIQTDLSKTFDERMVDSRVQGNDLNKEKRNSKNTWIPTNHWVAGFIWHYIEKANRENFLYDLTCIDGEAIQYTQYEEGQFYKWHNDSGISNMHDDNMVRKLSFVLQLSDPDDYEGGNLQLLDEGGKSYIAPRQRGTMILFDSRTQHRVLKVTKGCRKSLVGWTVGPRWK